MPKPAKVVGFVPFVILPFESTVVPKYVPGTTPVLINVSAPVADILASPLIGNEPTPAPFPIKICPFPEAFKGVATSLTPTQTFPVAKTLLVFKL